MSDQVLLDQYILNHISPEEDYLYELDRETNLKVIGSRMLSGHLQGQILSMISAMIKPLYILEIGTFTGYSALCLAQGLAEGGQLHTIELREADAAKAKSVYPQLEDVLKRTSTVISRHTMLDKRGNEKPESEKWIDDNWLLYGEALFYKHDYFQAIEIFKYVEATYKKEPTRFAASIMFSPFGTFSQSGFVRVIFFPGKTNP